jgi:hypothetical protein
VLLRNRRLLPALLAAGCLASVGAGCGSTHTTTKRPGSPATAQTTSTGGGAAAAPYSWAVDPSPALQVGGGASSTLAAVLAPSSAAGAGTGWQIAGTRTAADGTTTATVWSSPDAVTWSATSLPASGQDSQARAATTWGGRTLVVGSTGTGDSERAAAWLSPAPGQPFQQVDGGSAFAAPVTGSGPAGGAEMDVIAAGGLGAFAAGQVAGSQAMWYSTDGRHWTRLKGAEQVLDEATRPQVRALAVGADGVFAAGSEGDGAATAAAVWASTDGITWQTEKAATAFSGNGDHTISSLVSLGTGFVAAGGVRSGQSWSPASWISPNGDSWSQASLDFPMPSGPRPDTAGTEVNALASTTTAPASATTATGTLAAVGGSPTEQRLWTSTDGTSWSSVALPPAAAAAADWRAGKVATDGTTTIVVDDATGEPRVLVDRPQGWTEVTSTPGPFGAPRPTATPVRLLSTASSMVLVAQVNQPGQALGTETTGAAVFTSTDGRTWAPADTSAFTGADVTDLTAVSGGLVAVGGAAPLTSTLPSGPTGARAWTSTDGRAWTASAGGTAPGTSVFGGGAQGQAQASAVTRLGTTVVAVGDAAGSASGPADQAVAWTSGDGRTWAGPSPLDPQPSLAVEQPAGTCAGPQTVAAVGDAVGAGPGTVAAAWSSTDGTRWQPAAVTPTPDPAADEAMTSCISAGNGFIGFGAAQGQTGTDDPAVWYSSASGTQWTRQTVSAFAGTGLGPIKDLAVSGTTWLAVSGTGGLSTVPGGALGLWRSTDAGSTWQRLDTSGAPWAARQSASVDRVLLTSSGALVAGTVDGRLTLWVGTPTGGTPASGSDGSSTTAPAATGAATTTPASATTPPSSPTTAHPAG